MTRLVVLAAMALLVLAGCGETVIDSAKTEEQLESGLKKEQGIEVTSVDCPSDVEVKPGTSFTCTVDIKGGETQTATLKIRNEDADLSLVGLAPGQKPQPAKPDEGLGSNK